MNVLILGSGGREHAIAWKLAQSGRPLKLFVAPGNPGTASVAINLPVDPLDFQAVHDLIRDNQISMVVVGPEAPLTAGITDFLEDDPSLDGIVVIGPCRSGALLEGSKAFAKAFMKRHEIPTAAYETFTSATISEAIIFLKAMKPPYVIKADGLAAGKGVLIADTLEEAAGGLKEIFSGRFGEAGERVVIEEYLRGTELSLFVLTDGTSWKMLPHAKDYKRIGEGDRGKNTGGMGAVSPVPFATPAFLARVEERIIEPTIRGLKAEDIQYRGFIFFGLMNVDGDPYVIEYNVRLGDPESEVILPRISSDLYDLFEGVGAGDLRSRRLTISGETAVTVMVVSGGYPDTYRKGFPIHGTEEVTDSTLFHAGTRIENGELVTSGGRVLAVTSAGTTIDEALTKSYNSIRGISFEKMNYRKDIGFDLKDKEA